ncbi:MAG: hypothetical protein IJ040_02400 [Lachnospiraceae bacterium]|nr:hypothetical protein [Lachnospiraceae bacterium]
MKEENYFLGALGAIIGSIPGIILWVIIGLLGRVAVISGVVIAVGCLLGYCWLGKNISKVSAIICALVIIVATFVGINSNYIITFMKEFGCSFLEAATSLFYLISVDKGFMASYIGNMVIGYLFSIGGAILAFFKFFRV